MTGWRSIADAPPAVRDLAAGEHAELGRHRLRLAHEFYHDEAGRAALRSWVLGVGPFIGDPVTHFYGPIPSPIGPLEAGAAPRGVEPDRSRSVDDDPFANVIGEIFSLAEAVDAEPDRRFFRLLEYLHEFVCAEAHRIRGESFDRSTPPRPTLTRDDAWRPDRSGWYWVRLGGEWAPRRWDAERRTWDGAPAHRLPRLTIGSALHPPVDR